MTTRTTRNRIRSRLLRAVAAAALVACGGDPVSPLTPADVVGTYALQAVDGRPGPWPFPNGGGTALFASSHRFEADGTCTSTSVSGRLDDPTARDTSTTPPARWTFEPTAGGRRGILRRIYEVPRVGLDTTEYRIDDGGRRLTFDTGSSPGRVWVFTKAP